MHNNINYIYGILINGEFPAIFRSSDQRETTLKSESRKRRRSRSKERGMKKSKDNRSRDMAPTKNS